MSLDLISTAKGMGLARAPQETAVIAALVEAAARAALPEDVDRFLLHTALTYERDGEGTLTALAQVDGFTHVDALSRPIRDVPVHVEVTDENGVRVATSKVTWQLRALPVRRTEAPLRVAI
jgi:hypothetical protein